MGDPVWSYIEAVDACVPGFDTPEDRENVRRFREAMAELNVAFPSDAEVKAMLLAIDDPTERARVGHELVGKRYARLFVDDDG